MAAIDQLGGMTDDGSQPQNMQAMAGDAQPQAQAATSQQNSNVPQQAQPGGFFKSMLASILQGIGAGAGVGAGGDSRHADIGAAFHAGAQGAMQNSPLAIQQRNQGAQQEQQAFQSSEDLKKAQLANAIVQNQESSLRIKQMQDEYGQPLEAAVKQHAAAAIKSGAGKIIGTGDETDLQAQWKQIHGDGGQFLDHEIVPYKGAYALVEIKQGSDAPDKDTDYTLPGNKDLNVPDRTITQHEGEDNQQFWKVRYAQALNEQAKNLSLAASLKNAATKADTAHENNTLRAAALNAGNTTRIAIANIQQEGANARTSQADAQKSGDATEKSLAADVATKWNEVNKLATKTAGTLSGYFMPDSQEKAQAVSEYQLAAKALDAYRAKRQGGGATAAPAATPGFKKNADGSYEEQ